METHLIQVVQQNFTPLRCYAYSWKKNVNLNFYSETFDAVYKEAQSNGIPYRYYHLDSFMYPKQSGDKIVCDLSVAHSSGGNGLIVWDGCKELFPNGLSDVQESAVFDVAGLDQLKGNQIMRMRQSCTASYRKT